MLKSLKKILISLGSLFSLGVLFWIIILMNPALSYGHQTEFEKVTIYHDQELPPNSKNIIADAYKLLKSSELFSEEIQIQLCLNDGSSFPEGFPLRGGVAYSYWNKAIIYRSEPDFLKNRAFFRWEENQGQERSWNLVELLAHEFVHTLQSNHNRLSPLEDEVWKIEGYAEYISRSKREELRDLKVNISQLRAAQKNQSQGLPWIRFEDGSGAPLSYFRYRILIQFLMEQEELRYEEILKLEESEQEVEERMLKHKF